MEGGTKEYRMNHPRAGYCLVFTHEVFKGVSSRFHLTKNCVHQIADAFHGLGFEVLIHKDYTVAQIGSIIQKVASMDHSNEDCVSIVVLTARRRRGMLCAYDRDYPEELLWQHFSSEVCPSLHKKPKLFFLQTFDQSSPHTEDDFTRGSPASTLVPQGPIPDDCLISWCRMEDYHVCQKLGMEDVYARYLSRELTSSTQAGFDLVTILTRVETSVVNSMLTRPGFDGQSSSQWPIFASSLEGLVVFLRKNPENIKYEEPIDKDLEWYSESDEETDEGIEKEEGANGEVTVRNAQESTAVAKLEEGNAVAREVKVLEVGEEGKGGIKKRKMDEADEYSASCMMVFQRVIFIFLYLTDEGSDVYAAIKHLLSGRMAFAHLTFLFAAIPHIQSIWIGVEKAKIAKIKFDLFDALTYHIRTLWHCLIYCLKSRRTYSDLSLRELRAYYSHERAWKGVERAGAAWHGDSRKIQRMYYEKMMTLNLNLVPHDYLEVVNQAPFQIRSQLSSLMMEKRIPGRGDLAMIVSIFTSMITLTTATHKDHYRVHFFPDWTNSLKLSSRILECTSVLLIRGAHAVAMSIVAASQPLWVYCICQLPHSLWGMLLFIRSMAHPRYHFKKNPVKNALSLMGRSPTSLVFPWEYKTIENLLFMLDVVLLIMSWKLLPTDDTHPLLTWLTPVCIVAVHFIAMCLSFVYRTYCHKAECNPEMNII